MAYTTINKHTDYFNTKLYTGNGSTQSITGVGFQPDLTWIKRRDGGTAHHQVFDVIRGANKRIYPSSNAIEDTATDTLTSFDSDGFSVGANAGVNGSSNGTVAWNWKAGGSGSTNYDGSINSTVSVNTTAGFSIVKWTGDSSASATVGHGLGATPAVIITKEMNGEDWWHVYHKDLTADYNLFPNTTNAETKPSDGTLSNVGSSTFGFQGATNVVAVNESGINNIGYCFVEKTGYSKFGSYSGNGNSNGPFVYTGFKPAWIYIKRKNGTGNWQLLDNKRIGYNVENRTIYGSNIIEQDEDELDILSSGFKIRSTGTDANGSGDTYIYMAFGQSLVGSNNVPCTAR